MYSISAGAGSSTIRGLPGIVGNHRVNLIEKYNKSKHNTEAVKDLLAMAVGRPTPERLIQLLNEFYTTDGHTIFIAIQNDTITGMIGIDYTARPYGTITHIAVHPDMRMNGIGKSLINHVVKTLVLTSIALETDQDAVEFYQACGFEIKEIESRWPGVNRFRCSKDIS
jgi:ribosomal protein S18 acetylase RimI-like enzyme